MPQVVEPEILNREPSSPLLSFTQSELGHLQAQVLLVVFLSVIVNVLLCVKT